MSSNSPPNSDTEDSRGSPSKWSRNPLQLTLLGVGGVGKRKSAFLPYRPQLSPANASSASASCPPLSSSGASTFAPTLTLALNSSSAATTPPSSSTSSSKSNSTVLTNLQRGNTAATFCSTDVQLSFHERAGQGELSDDQVKAAVASKTIDATDKNGFTALHWACYYGQVATVGQLLATRAVDVSILAPDMVSPLLLAAAGGHHEVVRLLLQHGANARHADIVGNTPLMYAAAGNHPHTCNELLSKDPDLTATNEHGDTAYSLAMENGANLSQAVLEHYLTALLSI
ncbi:DNA-binding protein RFXANK [Episyrphus balteatus]|uniref:DNA-binding protein RFXANK n=1 Tax=Episyrphus balteatus TaxID=286459 RepID=UPI002485B688|nr:DNA-binding protein RFXANK [Episyrphus balteatus]